jgi:hypothetical protein
MVFFEELFIGTRKRAAVFTVEKAIYRHFE